jgi:co-chaperonin GroES (HSP10)
MARIKAESFTPLKNNVFVTALDSGERRSAGGIIIPDDNMKERGIRPRWGMIYAVGPDVDDLQPGDWVYVEHGRWTNGIDFDLPDGVVRVWRVDYPKAVLLASDIDPRDTIESVRI